jgi:predicted nucleic acid-binding protein
MTLFLDTAALVKFFAQEDGSDRVSHWILSNAGRIWIFELALLEYNSALFRKLRSREITRAVFEVARQGFQNELPRFHIEPIGGTTMRRAQELLETYGLSTALRTLDALHLAAFVLIAEEDWHFVTTDRVLLDTVKAMGYNTLNPLEA